MTFIDKEKLLDWLKVRIAATDDSQQSIDTYTRVIDRIASGSFDVANELKSIRCQHCSDIGCEKCTNVQVSEDGVTIENEQVKTLLPWSVIDKIAEETEPYYHAQVMQAFSLLNGRSTNIN